MKPAVFLTRMLPSPVMHRLKTLFDLKYNNHDRPLTKTELVRGMRGRPALISMLSDPIDAGVIESNPRLKIIANYAVGTNNIDLKAASSRGIIVTNTPGVLTDATADLTWSLILTLARRWSLAHSATQQVVRLTASSTAWGASVTPSAQQRAAAWTGINFSGAWTRQAALARSLVALTSVASPTPPLIGARQTGAASRTWGLTWAAPG
ncbi:MAG: hypothetical protein HY020_21290 [Burkholderiales bacterium]|nr:hypothetical protein [Burkholderiales bacterium]